MPSFSRKTKWCHSTLTMIFIFVTVGFVVVVTNFVFYAAFVIVIVGILKQMGMLG